jgi:hypothetical protein
MRLDFAFAASYRLPAAAFGVTPWTSYVDLDTDGVRVRFGPWRLRTTLDNIDEVSLSGGFAWWKTAGPAHLSFADRGVTFATNGEEGVCLTFREPVAGIDPTRLLRHPNALVTVADPASMVLRLNELRAASSGRH